MTKGIIIPYYGNSSSNPAGYSADINALISLAQQYRNVPVTWIPGIPVSDPLVISARSAGIKVISYVQTITPFSDTNGQIPTVDDVKRHIDMAYAAGSLDGIFLDEYSPLAAYTPWPPYNYLPPVTRSLDFYAQIINYIKATYNGLVVANGMGNGSYDVFFGSVQPDVWMVYENYGAPPAGYYSAFSFYTGGDGNDVVDPDRLSIIPHDTPSSSATNAVLQQNLNSASWIYFTDDCQAIGAGDGDQDPWNNISTYLDRQFAYLSSINPASTTTAAPTTTRAATTTAQPTTTAIPTTTGVPTTTLAPTTTQSPLTLNLYKGHGVFAQEEGLEPTVIVENGLIRMWYTQETYNGANKQIGGSSYGTSNYPFTGGQIYYRECPGDAFVTAVTTGATIPWQNAGSCISWHGRSSISKGPDGTYHCLAWCWGAYIGSPDNRPTQVDYYTSPDGNPGTWTLVQNGVLIPNPPYEAGNNSFFWDGTKWNVFLEYYNNLAGTWCIGYWTGASLTALTRVDSNSSPVMSPSTDGGYAISTGHFLPQQHVGNWIAFNHQCNRVGSFGTPTDLSLFASSSLSSGWGVNKAWVLRLATLQYFMGNPAYPFGPDSQIADPTVFEYGGKTFIMYETIWQELYEVPSLSVAWWNGTLDSVVAGYLGTSTTTQQATTTATPTTTLTPTTIAPTTLPANSTPYDVVMKLDNLYLGFSHSDNGALYLVSRNGTVVRLPLNSGTGVFNFTTGSGTYSINPAAIWT